jgi:hypothetical protein
MLTVLTPAVTHDLTKVEAVKLELGIAGDDQDAPLAAMIRQASEALARHCARTTFGEETYRQTERLAEPVEAIILERDLKIAVSAVTVNGEALDPAEWELEGSLLYRLSGDRRVAWCPGVVAVEYTAGYVLPDGAPADLARACLLTVTALWHARGRDPMLRSESAEGVGTTQWFAGGGAASRGLPSDALALVEPYRKWC